MAVRIGHARAAWLAFAVMGGIVASAAGSAAAEPSSATPPAATNTVCETADRLIGAGDPVGAGQLLERPDPGAAGKTYGDACSTQAAAAQQAVVAADGLIDRAVVLRRGTPDSAVREEIGRLIVDARKLNRHVDVRPEVVEFDAPKQAGSAPVDARSRWSAFETDVVGPAWDLLTKGLLALLLAVVAARLLVPVPGIDWRRSASSAKRWGVLGVILGCALAFAPMIVSWIGAPTVAQLVLMVLLGVAVAGSLGRAVSTRQRITIDRGSSSTSSDDGTTPLPSVITSHLEQLGSGPHRGVELTKGTDTTVLDKSTITALVNGGVVDLLKNSVVELLGVSPWRISVTSNKAQTGDGGESGAPVVHTITVSHNRRTRHSYTVTSADLTVGSETIPVEKMVAAAALTSLGEYFVRDFSAEAGTTKWRSLGWSYAAQDKDLPEPVRLELCQRAVAEDPFNMQAQHALWHLTYRDSRDPTTLLAYAEWLDWAEKVVVKRGHDPRSPLRLRMMYTAAAVTLNAQVLMTRSAAPSAPWPDTYSPPPPVSIPSADDAAKRVEKLVRALPGLYADPADPFVRHMWLLAFALMRCSHSPDVAPIGPAARLASEALNWSSVARYNEACRLVMADGDSSDEEIMRLLDFRLLRTESPIEAFGRDPYLTEWMDDRRTAALVERRTARGLSG
ncbi:hypothetical protein nbrc107696_27750 [Gordonia spumicola]|uniref:Uncharacterized protein n=1 Tax=Gordonia spumicola TaxID=589161 RepID=A0A7I9VAH6_9ACTN|nr:hypothetical protein [Gordonia spumicola]GEE02329.1 hypothetical protein nbrc107696_27750 [Gordonia spumicola]